MSYLGLDLSTQQLKAIILDPHQNDTTIYSDFVSFDDPLILQHADLIHTGVKHGRIVNGNRVQAPVSMWIYAMDLLLESMHRSGIDLKNVMAVSVSAQQHTSVYLTHDALVLLAGLDPQKPLAEQLCSGSLFLARPMAPTWEDSSTSEQCRFLERVVGGAQNLAKLTGSRAYERFTASQILGLFQTEPQVMSRCGSICLASSFLSSVLCGHVCGIDYSDASGMNLMDLDSRRWNDALLNAIDPALHEKLQEPISSVSKIGLVSPYFSARYGFNKDCLVVSGTGDNPAALCSIAPLYEELVISLGTSDTLIFSTQDRSTANGLDAHLFTHPIDITAYMGLICLKNGSLVREQLRNQHASGFWEEYETKISTTPTQPWLYFDFANTEISPTLQGRFFFMDGKSSSNPLGDVSGAQLLKAHLDTWILLMLHRLESAVSKLSFKRIIVVGGGSKNQAILQTISNVFNMDVYTLKQGGLSACLGAAHRARFVHQSTSNGEAESYEEFRKMVNIEKDLCVGATPTTNSSIRNGYKTLLGDLDKAMNHLASLV